MDAFLHTSCSLLGGNDLFIYKHCSWFMNWTGLGGKPCPTSAFLWKTHGGLEPKLEGQNCMMIFAVWWFSALGNFLLLFTRCVVRCQPLGLVRLKPGDSFLFEMWTLLSTDGSQDFVRAPRTPEARAPSSLEPLSLSWTIQREALTLKPRHTKINYKQRGFLASNISTPFRRSSEFFQRISKKNSTIGPKKYRKHSWPLLHW